MIRVDIAYGVARAGLPAAPSLRRWVAAALVGRPDSALLAIRIVDAAEGQALNRQYRGRDYPTNVLSFPALAMPGTPSELLGDIALCAPVIAAEAHAQGKPLQHHYAHLCVHGVLHLLGMDHQTPAQAEEMEEEEAAILATLRIPNPYAGDYVQD